MNDHNQKDQVIIYISALGMDGQKCDLLKKAFQLHKEACYRLCGPDQIDQAKLILLDIDGLQGSRLLSECAEQYPNIPVIIATIAGIDGMPFNYLAKPIDLVELFQKIRTILNGQQAEVNTFFSYHSRENKLSDKVAKNKTPDTVDQIAASGNAPTILQVNRFDPHIGLLGLTMRLYRNRQNFIICCGSTPLFILYSSSDEIVLLRPLTELKSACFKSDQICTARLQPSVHYPENPKVKTQAILWQLALWTAQGRLILDITPDSPLRLKSWPNLTRLAKIPHSFRMSAFLLRTPVSLRLIHRMLGIPIEDINNFIAATYAIALLEDPVIQADSEHHEVPVIELPRAIPQDSRNLLSRLLRRIIRI